MDDQDRQGGLNGIPLNTFGITRSAVAASRPLPQPLPGSRIAPTADSDGRLTGPGEGSHYPDSGFTAGPAITITGNDNWPRGATDGLPIACQLDDLELALRSVTVRRKLFALAEERRELPDGYAFRFAGTDDLMAKVNDFIVIERRCCSFFRIELVFEPGLGPIWLRLTGAEGVKRFVEETFDTERGYAGWGDSPAPS